MELRTSENIFLMQENILFNSINWIIVGFIHRKDSAFHIHKILVTPDPFIFHTSVKYRIKKSNHLTETHLRLTFGSQTYHSVCQNEVTEGFVVIVTERAKGLVYIHAGMYIHVFAPPSLY